MLTITGVVGRVGQRLTRDPSARQSRAGSSPQGPTSHFGDSWGFFVSPPHASLRIGPSIPSPSRKDSLLAPNEIQKAAHDAAAAAAAAATSTINWTGFFKAALAALLAILPTLFSAPTAPIPPPSIHTPAPK